MTHDLQVELEELVADGIKYSCLLAYAHSIECTFPHISAAYLVFVRSEYFLNAA